MAEAEATTEQSQEPEAQTQETVPYEKFQLINRRAKDEAEARRALEKKVADLTAAMEEREQAGLPELERFKKDLERAQARADAAEAKAAEADTKLARTTKERWVTAAAQAQGFQDPSDAAAFLALDDLEDERDAERAVKQLAKQKKHLLKVEDPQLPGRVLQNGQPATQGNGKLSPALEEAQMLSNALKDFVAKQ